MVPYYQLHGDKVALIIIYAASNQNFNCNIGCGNGRPWTGCVATSAAQIVRYWQPSLEQNYNYISMPANFGNTDVERLMSDLGKSVFMAYGCDASGAKSEFVPSALATQFSLGNPARDDYKWWVTAANLDNHWPVLLDAFTQQTYHNFIFQWWTPSGDGHEWVTDGYKQDMWTECNTTGVNAGRPTYNYGFLYLHMNWGWHETWVDALGLSDYNGWYMDQNWNINGLNLNFQYFVKATTNIHP